MATPKEIYYAKRGEILVKNLKSRHFDAYYCATREEALEKALELIPTGATVAWGGSMTCQEIGLMDALHRGDYRLLDRDQCETMEQRERLQREAFSADVFLSSANGLSLDGQLVNVDGTGNRVAPVIYGPASVLIIAGMNKVEDTLEDAVKRARWVAAPMNNQRFDNDNPCSVTGACGNCKNEKCICNHVVITRHGRPVGRIKFILVGEDLGM